MNIWYFVYLLNIVEGYVVLRKLDKPERLKKTGLDCSTGGISEPWYFTHY